MRKQQLTCGLQPVQPRVYTRGRLRLVERNGQKMGVVAASLSSETLPLLDLRIVQLYRARKR